VDTCRTKRDSTVIFMVRMQESGEASDLVMRRSSDISCNIRRHTHEERSIYLVIISLCTGNCDHEIVGTRAED
jgi:hypothetical protein